MDLITAAYVQDDADWTITVSGRGKALTARAPGIIAARDRADQLAEKLAPEPGRTVVHLLNGSAFDFTATYMQARLARTPEPPLAEPAAKAEPKKPRKTGATAAKPAAAKPAAARPRRTKPVAKRTTTKLPIDDPPTAKNGKSEVNGVLPEQATTSPTPAPAQQPATS